ncbi:MAG TPA: ankyrin repeat domain-containing protein [Bryobacteraceae bacterium]|nr:ankyrin repeat domain-containing protein [Bryobacteraceae bacterium]
MTSHPLPERANLERLKKEAKSLLHAAQARQPDALRRFQALPSRSSLSLDQVAAAALALNEAQSVIAREYGFKSWKELRDHVLDRSLSFTAAVDEFLRCATGNAAARALRLLDRFPAIAHASIFTELVLGDAEAVEARLRKRAAAATEPGGVQNWEPLLYVCHTYLACGETSLSQSGAARTGLPLPAPNLAACARALLARGADPNAEYHWDWHRELPRTALWAALCAVRSLPLAQTLLEAGANPTDGVSLHITAGGADLPSLELLHRFGVNVNGIPGGVPPLRYILGWAANTPERTAGIHWLLEHGADPNLAWSEAGDAPLHVAAERWDVAMVEALVRHGADIHRRRADGRTAHTVAALYGKGEIAAWLAEHGAADELSPLERFVAACASGDGPRASEMLRLRPNLRNELGGEQHLLMHAPAERGDAPALETMIACGFDANAKDRDGITPLHRAAMAGRPAAVLALIAGGADVNALDGMFSASPLVWATEGWKHDPHLDGVDHLAVARHLAAAGTSLDWVPPEKAPDPEGTLENLLELCRAAGLAR